MNAPLFQRVGHRIGNAFSRIGQRTVEIKKNGIVHGYFLSSDKIPPCPAERDLFWLCFVRHGQGEDDLGNLVC